MLRSTTAIRWRSQCSVNCEIIWSIFAWFTLVPRTRASPNTRVSAFTGWRAQNSTSCGVGSSSLLRSSWYRNWSATSRVFLRLPILSGAVRPPEAAGGLHGATTRPFARAGYARGMTRPFTRSGRGRARGAPTRPTVPQLMDPLGHLQGRIGGLLTAVAHLATRSLPRLLFTQGRDEPEGRRHAGRRQRARCLRELEGARHPVHLDRVGTKPGGP